MIIGREKQTKKKFKANYRGKKPKTTRTKFYGKPNWKHMELWGEKRDSLLLISLLFKNNYSLYKIKRKYHGCQRSWIWQPIQWKTNQPNQKSMEQENPLLMKVWDWET